MKLRRPTGTGSPDTSGGGSKFSSWGHRRVAAHAEVVLHPALGGQPVVVPAHRVEDRPPPHPLVAGDEVGVRVAEHVPHVQRPADRRRRRVDREHLVPPPAPVEPVNPLSLPPGPPSGLQPIKSRPLRNTPRTGRLIHRKKATGTARPPVSLRSVVVGPVGAAGGRRRERLAKSLRRPSPGVPALGCLGSRRGRGVTPGVLRRSRSELRRFLCRVAGRAAILPQPCASWRCRGSRPAPPVAPCRE